VPGRLLSQGEAAGGGKEWLALGRGKGVKNGRADRNSGAKNGYVKGRAATIQRGCRRKSRRISAVAGSSRDTEVKGEALTVGACV